MSDDIRWGETPPMTYLGIPGVGVWSFERGEAVPGVPMLALTSEVLEAIQSLLGDPSECRNAFIPCNGIDLCGGCRRAEEVRAAIAAAQKEAK
jgi:hypothetical protein